MRQGALFGKRAADVGNKWLLRAVGLRVQSISGNQEAQSDLPCQGQTLLAVERLFAFAAKICGNLPGLTSDKLSAYAMLLCQQNCRAS
jgi:hypothetical protein